MGFQQARGGEGERLCSAPESALSAVRSFSYVELMHWLPSCMLQSRKPCIDKESRSTVTAEHPRQPMVPRWGDRRARPTREMGVDASVHSFPATSFNWGLPVPGSVLSTEIQR